MYYSFLFLNNRAHTIKQREGEKKKSAATKAAAAKKKENRKQVRASKRKVSKQSTREHACRHMPKHYISFACSHSLDGIAIAIVFKWDLFQSTANSVESKSHSNQIKLRCMLLSAHNENRSFNLNAIVW